jgi:hypothetical protein
MKEPTHLFENK